MQLDAKALTGTGITFDLTNPKPRDVNLRVDVAEALARQACHAGHVRSGTYSMAQRCVIGADALFRETGNVTLAAQYLLHEAWQAYTGPVSAPLGRLISGAYDLPRLQQRLTAAIHAAVGLRLPVGPAADAIALMDKRMEETELRHLFGRNRHRQADILPIRLTGRLSVWTWPDAADEFCRRIDRWMPTAEKTAQPRPQKPAKTAPTRNPCPSNEAHHGNYS